MSFCPIPAAMPGGQPNPASSLGRVSLGIRGWGREAARSPFSNCKSQFFSFFSPLMTVGSPYKKPERRERGVGRDQAPAAAWGDVGAGRGFPARSLLGAAPSPGSDPYGSLCLPVGFILPSPSRM